MPDTPSLALDPNSHTFIPPVAEGVREQTAPWMRVTNVSVTGPNNRPEEHQYVSSPDETIVVPFAEGPDGVSRVILTERTMPAQGEGKTGISALSAAIMDDMSPADAARVALAKITPEHAGDQEPITPRPLFPHQPSRPWKYTDIDGHVMTCELPAESALAPVDAKTTRVVSYTEAEFLEAIQPKIVDGRVTPPKITDGQTIAAVLQAFLHRSGIPAAHPGFAHSPKIQGILRRLQPDDRLTTTLVDQAHQTHFPDKIVSGDKVIENGPQAQALGFRRNPDGSIASVVLIIEPSFAHKDGKPRGFLGLASGSVGSSPTILDAAVTELREEVGANPKPGKEAIPLTAGIHPMEAYATVSSTAYAVEIAGKIGKKAETADETPLEATKAIELSIPEAMYLLENGHISDVSTAVALFTFMRNVVGSPANKEHATRLSRAFQRVASALGRKSIEP